MEREKKSVDALRMAVGIMFAALAVLGCISFVEGSIITAI